MDGFGSTYSLSVHVSFNISIIFQHIIQGKLGVDVGQPGILTGDGRVSYTHPLGACGTPW